ncbi:MAG: oligosaccharide repeat unit polymerase, partial [Anaerolineales bacterium]|nr:oligosaccharide repeat unit polymerase [Anaerolineales bacterium]
MDEPQTLILAAVVDVITIFICLYLLIRYTRISFSHPAAIYFPFHVLSFSWRLWALTAGAPAIFENIPTFEAVTDQEIFRAMLVADAAFLMMTIAWIRASKDDNNHVQNHPQDAQIPSPMFSPEAFWLVIIPSFAIGLFGMFYFSLMPGNTQALSAGLNLGAWGRSSWLVSTQMWCGIVLLLLMHRYKVRWWLLVPFILYLLVMMYQGFHRSRVIIPVLVLFLLYLDQLNLKWPRIRHLVIIVLFFLLSLPMKEIGRMAQHGVSLVQIVDYSAESIYSSGSNGLPYLDQFASTLTLLDRYGEYFYLKTYLPMLTLPIPRALYPGKPLGGFYVYEISTTTRPMGRNGMITTLHGQSYVAFGYIGVFCIAYFFAYLLGRYYHRAYRCPSESVYRLIYLVVAVSLIQVYRDGLLSLLVFTAVYMMPVFILAIVNKF